MALAERSEMKCGEGCLSTETVVCFLYSESIVGARECCEV